MIKPLRAPIRKGYALTVVLIFLILLIALWSAVTRSTASLLRIETDRVLQQTRDQGVMNAMGQALQLLQYSTPSDPLNPTRTQFTYGVEVTVQGANGSSTIVNLTVQYSPVSQTPCGPAMQIGCTQQWQVQVSPGTCNIPLPTPSSGVPPTVQWR